MSRSGPGGTDPAGPQRLPQKCSSLVESRVLTMMLWLGRRDLLLISDRYPGHSGASLALRGQQGGRCLPIRPAARYNDVLCSWRRAGAARPPTETRFRASLRRRHGFVTACVPASGHAGAVSSALPLPGCLALRAAASTHSITLPKASATLNEIGEVRSSRKAPAYWHRARRAVAHYLAIRASSMETTKNQVIEDT